jgi:hypothetical protein
VWREYAAEAAQGGVGPTLRQKLVQLRFPIRQGISREAGYRAATLRGIAPEPAPEAWTPVDSAGLQLFLQPTVVGAIPVLQVRQRPDFVALVRMLTRRNEPEAVPDSMGATMVAGLANWDRIDRYRRAWAEANPLAACTGGWAAEFARLIPNKESYQDRLIIISQGAYSHVSAAAVGLGEEEWQRLSVTIRLHHECTHYFTRRVFGSMQNALHDELLADYAGMVQAVGSFRPEWFLRFMGLEEFPRYRVGGRLENYLGSPPPRPALFTLLQRLVERAAVGLAGWDQRLRATAGKPPDETAMVAAVASLHLEELAADQAGGLLDRALTARGQLV